LRSLKFVGIVAAEREWKAWAHKYRVEGNPDPKHVSTSFVERSNLSIRMGNGRMTRLTNAFSKKAENHAHTMAIYFMPYIFVIGRLGSVTGRRMNNALIAMIPHEQEAYYHEFFSAPLR
jgi:hypothetical protein